ncbi:hypothetical protein LguiA_026150 [Lonicera macranthoides]
MRWLRNGVEPKKVDGAKEKKNIDTTSFSTELNSNNPSCPICLGPFLQESYLDHCFHKFCFKCIMHWTNVVTSKNSSPAASVKCPLCKEEDVDIIAHHIHGE